MLLKSFEERHDPALGVDSLLAKLRSEFQAVREANVIAFNLPPIIGLGTGSGFEYQLQDLRGGDPAELAAAARGLVFTANQDPALRAVFTTYSANTPQLYLDVDRDKVQTLGISVGDVFNALQAILGGFYINDFNLFGRTWQVNVQAEAADRAKVDDIYRIHVRNRQGQMVPLRAFAEPRLTLAAADHRPLQQLSQCHAERRPRRGQELGRGDRRHGAPLRHHAAPGLRKRNGLSKADLDVSAKLPEQRLERGEEAEAFPGRQVVGEDDLLQLGVAQRVEVEVARQVAP